MAQTSRQTKQQTSRSNPARSGNPAKRAAVVQQRGPVTFGDWLAGARLRTLTLAIAPVAAGTGAALLVSGPGAYHWVRALLALAVALALQIGVNYANDYSDGIRGTDAHRVGPARLTGSGSVAPRNVLTVAIVFFGIAAIAGLVLVVLTQQWWLLVVGAVAILAAWFYTGGKRPYGYYGLGELVVFVFFGLVATAGTMYVQVLTVNLEAWVSGVAVGLVACAVLMVNNIRDLEQDRLVGKRTLAVLIGPVASKVLFCIFLLAPFVIVVFFALFYPLAWFVLFALLIALPACLITVTAKTAPELVLALKLTSVVGLVLGLGLGAAFAF
ncbi:MAG: 1,4-dihydroxy-2-naphthoate polyprenyltransferase [Leifsonia sp.]